MKLEEMGRMLTAMKSTLTQWAPKEIDRDLINIWLSVLKDYPDEVIHSAFRKALMTLTEWPAPAGIKRLCDGVSFSDEEIGQAVALRIESAMAIIGGPMPDIGGKIVCQKAKEHIGELGWAVVTRLGGWGAICDTKDAEMSSSKKQWRDLACMLSKEFHNRADIPTALPGGQNIRLIGEG